MRDWISSKKSTAEGLPSEISAAPFEIDQLQEVIGSVILGKKETVKLALVALIAKGHLLIEDVPGIGKTTLANSLANALDLSFQRIQFTSDLLPSDVLGISIYNQREGSFEWKSGPIFANIILADEINRATPKTQSALLEAMAEEQVTIEGVSRKLPLPFMVVATQNPKEHHGTYPLPESQLDRFMLRLHIGYPDLESERRILRDRQQSSPLNRITPVISEDAVREMQKKAKEIFVDDSLVDYLLRIVEQTRNNEAIDLGVSPRGSLALFHSAQALALIEGRDFCIPDDIKRLVVPCFGHRIIVRSQNRISAATTNEAEQILNQILSNISVPE
ncbi:MAG: MoxR family ATPase [Acidobacteria bacterium]|nr:MoxR family ATPase [Acidobacteriota bacterium]